MLTETLTIATCGISSILSVFIDSAAESRKKKLTAYLQKTPKHSRVTNSPKQRKPETDMQTQQQKPNNVSEFKPNIAFTHRLYSSFMQCMYCSICWILRSVEIQGNKQQVVQDSTGVTSQVLSGSHTLLVLIGFQKKMSVTHPIFTHITSSPLKVPWSCYLPCTWAMSDQRVWQLGECKQTTPFIGGSLKVKLSTIRRPGSACTVFFSYVASKILSQGAHPKSPVQNPKSKIPKIQNPQNPKSPKSKIQTLHIKICYIMFQKSKIQNPQNPENPKSTIPKIQNPQNPKSKIQNPQNPKSKLFWPDFGDFGDFGFWGFWILDSGPKIQNPNSPKSKIQNPQNPKSKIPKIQIQNP